MSRVPLALFTYNRPRHTERALNALARNHRLEDVRVIIYSDAPKRPEHAEAVASTRRLIAKWASEHKAEVVERRENLGLARSIAGSVSELTQEFGRAIVLEDDLVAAPDCISFMLEGLERYKDEPRVMQISGCLLTGARTTEVDGLFLPLTTTWGWATWSRAWTHFRWENAIDTADLDRIEGFRQRFTLDGHADYVSMLKDRLAGANDSWGVLWWFTVARQNGLVLYPRRSLIWNGGFDNSGVHCGGVADFEPEPPEDYLRNVFTGPLRLPEQIAPDAETFSAVKSALFGGLRGTELAIERSWGARLRALLRRVSS